MGQSLKSKSAKGFAWNFGGSLLQQGSTFIVSIFLARILSPAEFGLVGMAMVFITVSQVFIDVGFASALIQRQDNTSLTYSSIFYLNIVIGLLLTAGFYFCAPLIGAFYKNPQVTSLVRWLSLIFVFNSFDIVQMTILKKELNFKTLTVRTFLATIIGGIAGVIAAFSGLGVYSIVVQKVLTAVLGTVFLWSTTTWRPDLKFSFKEVKKLTGYSAFIFFDQVYYQITIQLDMLIGGKVFSPKVLGYYSRANSLRNLVTQYSSSSLTAVFFPVLSSLQDKEEEYRRVYFKVISVIAFISYGLTGVMCILGRDIIITLFGAKWEPSIPIFQVLILSAGNTPLNNMMNNAFYSKGKSKENFWIGVFRKSLRFLPLFMMYYSGMFAFTIGLVIINFIIIIFNIFFLKRFLGLSAKKHFQKIFEGLLPLSIVLVGFFYFHVDTTWMRIIWAIGFVVIYVFSSKLMKTEGLVFIMNNMPAITKKFTSNFPILKNKLSRITN